MRRMFLSIPTAERRKGYVRVLLFQGTSQLAKLRHLHLRRGDKIVVIDNDEELRRFRGLLAGKGNVHFFALGNGQTAMTLLVNASPEVRRCLRKMANMPAGSGMGQLRELGHAAAEMLCDSEHFQAFTKQFTHQLDRIAGGNVRHVDFIVFFGLCGGTGTAVPPVIRVLVGASLTYLNVTVHTHFEPLGPKTFIDLGERIEHNAAASIADISAYVIDHNIDPRETRSVGYFELPPTGFDQETRNAFLLLDEQAIAAQEVQAHLWRIAPNHSPDSPFGNITWRHTKFANFLPPEQVAAQIAPAYIEDIKNAEQNVVPNPSLVIGLNLDPLRIPLSREPVESIVETALSRETDEVIAALMYPEARLQFNVRAEMANGSEYEITSFASAVSATPTTLSEVVERLIEQASLRHVLQQEINIQADALEELEEDVAYAIRRLRSAHRARCGQGFWNRATSGWISQARRQRRLADCAMKLRELSDSRYRTMAELQSLQHSMAQVVEATTYRLGRLRAVARELSNHRPRGQGNNRKPWILLNSIDDVWSRIDRLDELPSQEQVEQICFGAFGASIEGLAAIVGAEDAQLELVAKKIAEGEFLTEGPYWGGVQRVDGGERMVVLPPVTPDVRERLPQLVAALDKNLKVYFADHAAAGLNALLCTFYRVRSAKDLFPGRLLKALVEAYQSPLAPMFFPEGTDCLRKLGMVVDEQGNVTFVNFS